jgi:hypothetical protein
MISNKKVLSFDLKSCESCDITYKYIIYNDFVDS